MEIFEIVSGVLLILGGMLLITMILLQRNKSKGLGGAIAGDTNVGAARGKAKSMNAMLNKWTKVVAIVIVAIVLVLNVVSRIAN